MNISRQKYLIGVLTLAASIMVCTPVEILAKGTAWTLKMRDLEKSLQELLVDISSDERFNSPKNFKRIETNTKKLSKLAHALKAKEGASPDLDPSLKIIANLFSQEAEHAYKTLIGGHRDYARGVLKSMTGYCIACHTRNNSGPSFSFLQSESNALIRSLSDLDRANYFTSVRQFDRALEEYERIVNEKVNAERRPSDWEQALRSGLAVAVRVKKDPDRAQSLVEKVLSNSKAPYFLKKQAIAWKKSIENWKAETPVRAQTEEGYYVLAIRLLADAKTLQKYPADRSADILYLRASSAAHDLLSVGSNGAHTADGFYMAGLSYEVLNDLNLWDVHEFYYLACIHQAPHTEKARECFRHYQESIYHGYTGSSGTHIPPEIREKLNYFEQMATPPGKKTDSVLD